MKKRPNLENEARLWQQSGAFVIGVDEAGRGCLAGPVVAAAACWAPHSQKFAPVVDVFDSKVMSEAQREAAFEPLTEALFAYGVGVASAQEVDEWNILRATHLAVGRALEICLRSMASKGGLVSGEGANKISFLSDGASSLVKPALAFSSLTKFSSELVQLSCLDRRKITDESFVKGDSKVFSIASASVLAKVSRDRIMQDVHKAYPAYDFGRHKGYGTAAHMKALQSVGPCIEHRKTFGPVAALL